MVSAILTTSCPWYGMLGVRKYLWFLNKRIFFYLCCILCRPIFQWMIDQDLLDPLIGPTAARCSQWYLSSCVINILSISLKEKYACVSKVAWCTSVAEMRDHANHFSHCNGCVNYVWTVLEPTEVIPVILAMTSPNVVLLACGAFNPPTNMHLRMFGEFV